MVDPTNLPGGDQAVFRVTARDGQHATSSTLDLVVQVPHLAAPGETVLGPELLRATGGKGANQAVAAARLGGSVSLFAAIGDDAAGAETTRALDRLLDVIDVLVVNEHEALALCPGMEQDWDAVARRLLDLGPAAAVVTLGAAGAVAADGQATWHEPAAVVEVVDTTGAGDAFCGALALALARSEDLATAVERGCVAGALACTGHGAVLRGGG